MNNRYAGPLSDCVIIMYFLFVPGNTLKYSNKSIPAAYLRLLLKRRFPATNIPAIKTNMNQRCFNTAVRLF